MDLRKERKEFAEDTTFHGIRIVCGEVFIWRRIVWLLIVSSMFLIFLYTLVHSLVLYNRYESTISITKDTADRLTLPVITLCNINLYHHSKIKANYPELEPYFVAYFENGDVAMNDSVRARLKEVSVEEFMTRISATAEDVFVDCRDSNLFQLNCSEHVLAQLTNSGVCYSFNAGQGHTKPLTRSLPGMSYEVSLTLDVNPRDSFGMASQGEGFYVQVHDQSVFPQVAVNGFVIGPGQEVFISLYKKVSKILPKPYSHEDCVEEGTMEDRADGFNSWPGYSQEECQYHCMMEYLSSNSCILLPSQHSSTGRPPCSLHSIFTVQLSNLTEMSKTGFQCKCLPKCTYTSYQPKISQAKFPNKQVSSFAAAHGWPIIDQEKIASRYTHVHLYFEDMRYTISEQQPSMNTVQLVSNVGGQLGLCIGASVVSIVELLDFIIIMIVKYSPCFKHLKEKSSTKIQVLKDTNT